MGETKLVQTTVKYMSAKVENHQRGNDKPRQNNDDRGWRRLETKLNYDAAHF